MAKIKPKKITNSKYNWELWFSKRKLKLEQRKDFTCQLYSMVIQLRQQASKRNRVIHIDVVGYTILVTIEPEGA